jgi:hypothetical protein
LRQEGYGPDGVFGGMRENHLTRPLCPVVKERGWHVISLEFSRVNCAKSHIPVCFLAASWRLHWITLSDFPLSPFF